METKNALIICDVQSAYEKLFDSNYVYKVLKLANASLAKQQKVYWFWNGPELGMENESVLKDWLYNIIADYNLFELDYNEDNFIEIECTLSNNLFDQIKFIDKTYGSLRIAIDKGYSYDIILYLLKYMHNNNIIDFSDCGFNDLLFHFNLNGEIDLIELVELIQYLNNTGEFFGFDTSIYEHLCNLDNKTVYTLIGGIRNQCLYELELQLEAIGLNVVVNDDLTY